MVTCSRLLKFQPTQESDSESDKRRVQILCKMSSGGWNGKVPTVHSFTSLFKNLCIKFPILPFILSLIWESLRLLKVATVRALAPLRVVVSRSLEVFEYQRAGARHPRLFVVNDLLDCGHTFASHLWDFLDLVNGYATGTHVTARRHRCHECRDIAKAKKPSVSVGLVKAAAIALVFLFAAIAHAQEDSKCTKTISLERSFNLSLLAQEKLSESHYAHCATMGPSGLPLEMIADGKKSKTSPQSKFFDTPRIVSTSLNFSLRTFDVVNTCRGFADHTFVEDYLPAKTCGGVAAISYGFAFGALGAERLFYKHHPRLARVPQWLSVAGAAVGIAYTLKHGGVR